MYPGRVRRPRLPHRLRAARLPRHRTKVCGVAAARRASRTAAGCRSRSSPRRPRPSSATTTRTSRTTPSPPPSAPTRAARLRDLTLAGLRPRRGDRPRARHHPGRHQARVRRPPDGTTVLADEVLTPDSSRFWPAAEWQPGPHPAVVRQADRAQLGALARVRLGPRVGRGAAAAAARGRRAHPQPVRRGLRAAHRGVVLSRDSGPSSSRSRREVAFDYLADPRHRPEWQSSLARVEDVDGEPRVGQTWVDVTTPGLRPAMETTELDRPHRWTERGTWRGFSADAHAHLHRRRRPAATSRRPWADADAGSPAPVARGAGHRWRRTPCAPTCARRPAPSRVVTTE